MSFIDELKLKTIYIMGLNWSYIFVACTLVIYLVLAFVQFRRAWLMRARVKFLSEKGKRVAGKILSYGRANYTEVEFINHSSSRVITDFRINQIDNLLPIGSEVFVLQGDNPQNSPALVLEYNNEPIPPNVTKYFIYGLILTVIALILVAILFTVSDVAISKYVGFLLIPIAAIGIFIAVTEEEMAQNRFRNLLLLFGYNATAKIRKASSTGIVKKGYKQISFFVAYMDKDGKTRFGKAEEPLDIKDFQYFKEEKRVDILYSVGTVDCLLNYTWQ